MRVCSLTYLDQGAGSASTIGWVGFYSPSAHRNGLLFDEETELTLQASPDRSFVLSLPPGGASKPSGGGTSTSGSFATTFTVLPKSSAPGKRSAI